MKNYRAFPFLRKIYFVRTAGSEEEIKAANLIKEEIERLGGEAHLEAFEIESLFIWISSISLNYKFEI